MTLSSHYMHPGALGQGGVAADGGQGLPAAAGILHSSIASSAVSNAGLLNNQASAGTAHENAQASQLALQKARELAKRDTSLPAQPREGTHGSKLHSHLTSIQNT